jgi:squalene-associated FAD-dependent desaturase
LSVALIEAAPQLGGRARTLVTNMGFGTVHLDNGQHLMMGAYRDTIALVRRVNAHADHWLRRSPLTLRDTQGMQLRAPRLPAPFHLAAALAGARGMSVSERIACARFMLWLKRRDWRVENGETVGSLLARARQPDELVNRLWHPLCVSALNTPPQSACAQTFSIVLRDTLGADRASSDFVVPTGSLGDCLPTPAAAWLAGRGAQIRIRTPVRGLRETADGWQVIVPDGMINARGVVLAVPPSNGAKLLRTVGMTAPGSDLIKLVEQLEAFRPVPIATTYVAWPAIAIGPMAPWIMLAQQPQTNPADGHSDPLGDWVFDRGVQQGHRIASILASAVVPPDTGAVEHLTRRMVSTATRALGLPAPAYTMTVIERRATFACVPDRPRIASTPVGRLPSLWLAGDYAYPDYPATIESAVRSGLQAGGSAADSLRQTHHAVQSQAALSA